MPNKASSDQIRMIFQHKDWNKTRTNYLTNFLNDISKTAFSSIYNVKIESPNL